MWSTTSAAGARSSSTILAWLAARGYADVEPVTLTEETLVFSLPPELRSLTELRSSRDPG
ncbi:hypothetical protein [Nonomuraea aurantiaca]|uniref:hypothetical protein n=1 Tax=Nonomuraea aurantiaca TaxID=2878562 RepID=UPI001CD92D4E|nr:hypothetical protein [Nonomuraea aurantiaca]MCA2224106.1 hypothetical protein [Nonomuraea aurantiaca]